MRFTLVLHQREHSITTFPRRVKGTVHDKRSPTRILRTNDSSPTRGPLARVFLSLSDGAPRAPMDRFAGVVDVFDGILTRYLSIFTKTKHACDLPSSAATFFSSDSQRMARDHILSLHWVPTLCY